MDWKVILDLVIAVLLLATIGYATTLNVRLTQLRKNRDDLARIIVSFNEATVRAESSIPKLKKAADEAGMSLQERVDKAQSLRDDLAFMIERADSMANRLETAVRQARNEARVPPSLGGSSGTLASNSGPTLVPPTLLGGQGSLGSRPAAPAQNPAGSPPHPAASSGSMMDLDDERSQAELELLRALQSMR